jgi:hypothetical protein
LGAASPVEFVSRGERVSDFGTGVLALAAVLLTWPLLVTYLETGLVPRMPTAILATGLMLVAVLSLTCGAVLDTVTRGRRELKRLHYLGVAGLWARHSQRSGTGQGFE